MAYIGDGNNMAHSLMIASAKVGMDFSIACPDGYKPNEAVTEMALKFAKETGCKNCDYRRSNRSSKRC